METDYTNNPYIPKVSFELIPIKDLVSNQVYQRNLSEKHVKRTAESFDVYQINPIKVSRRDGINYVFNGQHTMEIIARVSGSRDTPVWCMVFDDLVYQHEADIFANQQKHIKALTSYEIFMAQIEAGDDKQLLIKDLVESYGLKLCPIAKPCGICGIKALELIYDKYGYDVLSRTLRLVVGTWEGLQQSLGGSMLKGVAKVLDTFDMEIKDDAFVEKLGSVSAKEIIRIARERKGGQMGYAEAILITYNRKLRYPLPIENLYRKVNKERRNNGEFIENAAELITTADAYVEQESENGYMAEVGR